jgi:hypothetical protein
MALPTSGSLTLEQIQTEFGGSNPISLNEYYAGGANVPAGTSGTNGAVPSSGTISISNFYGTQKVAPTFTFSISQHIDRANLRSLAVAAGWNQSSAVIATLASGYYIYSTSVGTPALTIDGSFPGGVTLVNNGFIMGKGGNGASPTSTSYNSVSAGQNGGHGISLGVSCTIFNNSYIAGGGGGGGGNGSTGQYSTIIEPGGGGAGGGEGGRGYNSLAAVFATGGGGGGLGSSGANGGLSTGAYTNHGAGGGGRVLPSSRTTQVNVRAAGANPGLGGSGGGTPLKAIASVDTYGGGPNEAGFSTTSATTGTTGGGGGGWGASGGSSFNATALYVSAVYIAPFGAGGKCVALNGYSVSWAATGNRYGAIS